MEASSCRQNVGGFHEVTKAARTTFSDHTFSTDGGGPGERAAIYRTHAWGRDFHERFAQGSDGAGAILDHLVTALPQPGGCDQ